MADAAKQPRYEMRRVWEGSKQLAEALADGFEPFWMRHVVDGRISGNAIYLRRRVAP